MLKQTVRLVNTLFPSLPWSVSRWWFDFISSVDTGTAMLFMNYGYSDFGLTAERLRLDAEDEQHRFGIQLYDHLARTIDWRGLKALEVGCGRGGGSSYVRRYLRPKSMIGLDICANAIDFCNRHYAIEGLSFIRGDAQSLQFTDNSIDVLLNIESSICYPNVERFLGEVVRVLRPNGFFLYADLRQQEEVEAWREQLVATGLELVRERNITRNVVQALDVDNARKQQLIDQYAPKLLRKPFGEFAGMKGSEFFYSPLSNGSKQYLSFVFRKPDP